MDIKPLSLYTSDEIRHCEQLAKTSLKLTEEALMERAAVASLAVIKRKFSKTKKIAVYCGGGNNGGDGYWLAYLLASEGRDVTIYQATSINDLKPTAKHAASLAISASIPCVPLNAPLNDESDLIVDALLGIGFQGELSKTFEEVIDAINKSLCPVFSIDCPSGLNPDTGWIEKVAINANTTLTFIGAKPGFFTACGPDTCGDLLVDDLGLSTILVNTESATQLLTEKVFDATIAPRRKQSHKGDFGRVLVIGGGRGMLGAPYLAAKACMRVGAGLVTIACHPDYEGMGTAILPEALCYGIDEPSALMPLLERADVCILGPGLGTDEWAEAVFHKAIASQLPMIIDASALHFLSAHPQHDDNWVLTPHPGEAAVLLQTKLKQIESSRFQAATMLQLQYGGTIVLKGNGTIVQTHKAYVCPFGNPAMASAGMGDVLTGVIAGLYVQGIPLAKAAMLGVLLHAKAGDSVFEEFGIRGLLASDLFPYLRVLAADL